MSRTVEDIIEIGRDLIAVKAAIGHGNFCHWIQAEFGMSLNSALRFINVAERFGDKFATVANLAPSVLYTLAAPSTDEAVVEEIVERAAAGEPVTRDDVAVLKAEKKELKRLLDEAERFGTKSATVADLSPAVLYALEVVDCGSGVSRFCRPCSVRVVSVGGLGLSICSVNSGSGMFAMRTACFA